MYRTRNVFTRKNAIAILVIASIVTLVLYMSGILLGPIAWSVVVLIILIIAVVKRR